MLRGICDHTRKDITWNDCTLWGVGVTPIKEMLTTSFKVIWTHIKTIGSTSEESRLHGFSPMKRGRGFYGE